jgi:hypothetical protein
MGRSAPGPWVGLPQRPVFEVSGFESSPIVLRTSVHAPGLRHHARIGTVQWPARFRVGRRGRRSARQDPDGAACCLASARGQQRKGGRQAAGHRCGCAVRSSDRTWERLQARRAAHVAGSRAAVRGRAAKPEDMSASAPCSVQMRSCSELRFVLHEGVRSAFCGCLLDTSMGTSPNRNAPNIGVTSIAQV